MKVQTIFSTSIISLFLLFSSAILADGNQQLEKCLKDTPVQCGGSSADYESSDSFNCVTNAVSKCEDQELDYQISSACKDCINNVITKYNQAINDCDGKKPCELTAVIALRVNIMMCILDNCVPSDNTENN